MVFAGIWLAFGMFYLYLGIDKVIHRRYMAQGWFPFLIGLAFVISASLCLLQGHRIDKNEKSGLKWKPLFLIGCTSVALVFFIRWFGILAASFVYSAGLMIALSYPWKKAVPIAGAITLFIYAVFVRMITIVF